MSVALSMAVLGVVHAGHFGHVGHIGRSCWSKYLSSVCGTVAVLICGWLAGSQSGPTYMHHSAPQCSQTSRKCLENVRPTSHLGYPINPWIQFWTNPLSIMNAALKMLSSLHACNSLTIVYPELLATDCPIDAIKGVVFILCNHFWGSQEKPPPYPLCR